MARSAPMWWPWVQRNLDAHGWRPADLAHEIGRQVDDGPSESAIGRWKNQGSAPTRESVRAVAAAFHRPAREALIAAGWVTAGELDAPWADPSHIDLTAVPDEALADEVVARLVRRRRTPHSNHQPAANGHGPSRTAITTTGSGSSRHTVPTGTTTAPPSSGEDERAGRDTAHCA